MKVIFQEKVVKMIEKGSHFSCRQKSKYLQGHPISFFYELIFKEI